MGIETSNETEILNCNATRSSLSALIQECEEAVKQRLKDIGIDENMRKNLERQGLEIKVDRGRMSIIGNQKIQKDNPVYYYEGSDGKYNIASLSSIDLGDVKSALKVEVTFETKQQKVQLGDRFENVAATILSITVYYPSGSKKSSFTFFGNQGRLLLLKEGQDTLVNR